MPPRNILVVDDDPDDRKRAADALAIPGNHVATAADGVEALSRIGEGFVPHVVVLDMLMPRMDGAMFLEQLEASALRPRIVVVTGVQLPALKRLLRADAVIFKPYDPAELQRAVDGDREP